MSRMLTARARSPHVLGDQMRKLETSVRLMRNLSAPRRLRAEVAQEATAPPRAVNTHVHLPPNFSAFSSVAQAAEMAHAAGLSVLGAGNYYDFSVYGEFAAERARHGLFPLYGMEVMALAATCGTRV